MNLRIGRYAGHQWVVPVILATQEAKDYSLKPAWANK
jgi:hypothetical protein